MNSLQISFRTKQSALDRTREPTLSHPRVFLSFRVSRTSGRNLVLKFSLRRNWERAGAYENEGIHAGEIVFSGQSEGSPTACLFFVCAVSAIPFDGDVSKRGTFRKLEGIGIDRILSGIGNPKKITWRHQYQYGLFSNYIVYYLDRIADTIAIPRMYFVSCKDRQWVFNNIVRFVEFLPFFMTLI